MQSSHSTQLAVARAIADVRDAMVTEWADWMANRPGAGIFPRPVLERQLRLVVDTLVEMLGPLRREAKPVWARVLEHYGRVAAVRGLAAGEVVEELQQLRYLLIKHIGAVVAAMRTRRAVAVFVRLNVVVDRAVTEAVVAYTDALVGSLLMTDHQSQSLTDASADDVSRQLEGLQATLATITSRR